MGVYEDNGKSVGIMKRRTRKVQWFSSIYFWTNVGCLVSAHTFGIGR